MFGNAAYYLGICYSGGLGVAKDEIAATEWFLKAAMRGHSKAQATLGARYLKGVGTIKDFVEGFAWFYVSSASGDEKSKEVLPLFEESMTREQFAEATNRAKEIFAKIKKTN